MNASRYNSLMETKTFPGGTNYYGNLPSELLPQVQASPNLRSATVADSSLTTSYGASQSSSQDTNPSSITDSDSVASLSESEAGSLFENPISTATSQPPATFPFTAAVKLSKDSPEIRAVHNVSEQFRRKFLRSCFDNLQKEVVTESSQKASHLLILTSAIEVVQQVSGIFLRLSFSQLTQSLSVLKLREVLIHPCSQIKAKDSFITGELFRLTEERSALKARLDNLVDAIRTADPSIDLDDILLREPLGIPDTTLSSSLLDRQDSLQVGEVEITSSLSNRKRQADSGNDNDLLGSLSGSPPSKMSPALTAQKRAKKSRARNHITENHNGLVHSTVSLSTSSEVAQLQESSAKRKLSPRKYPTIPHL